MTFAGGFFAEEIEDRVAIMFVVQIEVSFVSTRRESDKTGEDKYLGSFWLLPINIALP